MTAPVRSTARRFEEQVAVRSISESGGRIGRPEEVAALVAFLASAEAPCICGAVVEITGAQVPG